MSEGKLYVNGKYFCDAECEEGIPNITAEMGPYTEVEDIPALGPTICVDRNYEATFTSYTKKCAKRFKRLITCKSRKRFIKKLMSLGIDRNDAVYSAAYVLYMYSRSIEAQRSGISPYQLFWNTMVELNVNNCLYDVLKEGFGKED